LVQKEDAKGKTSKGRKRKRPIAGTTIKLADSIEKTPENSLSEEESKIKDEGKETMGVESVEGESNKKILNKGGNIMDDETRNAFRRQDEQMQQVAKSMQDVVGSLKAVGEAIKPTVEERKVKQEENRFREQIKPIVTEQVTEELDKFKASLSTKSPEEQIQSEIPEDKKVPKKHLPSQPFNNFYDSFFLK